MTKVCTKCKINKSLEDYYRDNRYKDGKQSECKSCTIIRTKKYKKSDKGRLTQIKANAKYKKSDKGRLANAKYDKSDKGKSAQAKYKKTDKGKAAIARNNCSKTIWKSKVINDLITEEEKVVMFLQNYQCIGPDCESGRYFDMVGSTRDHIKPLSKGGALTKDNIQFLCQSCNSKKSIQDIDYRTQIHKDIINQFTIV